MTKYIIAFASVTQANKALAVFVKNGVNARLTRNSPAGITRGCGYRVIAEGSADELAGLLENNGVSYNSISRA